VAKYKLCWLVKEEVHPNKFEKAVENHLKDYRSTHRKTIKKVEEEEEENA